MQYLLVAFLAFLMLIYQKPTVAEAGQYPERVVRIVVTTPPATASDAMTRLVAESLSKTLGQSFIVENRREGLGLPGTKHVLDQEPDGYTLLAGQNGNFGVALALQKKAPYDPTEVTPICFIARYPMVVVVPFNSPIRTFSDLVKVAQANPGKLNWGFGRQASPAYVGGIALNQKAGIRAAGIPMGPEPMVINELIAGRLDYGVVLAPTARPQTGGENPPLRAIALFAKGRSLFFPEVPTTGELGLSGLDELEGVAFLAGPKGMPSQTISILSGALKKALEDPSVLRQLDAFAATPYLADGNAVKAWISAHRAVIERTINENNVPRE